MLLRLILISSFFLGLLTGNAQQTPLEIKYRAWNIHALRYYPFEQPADSFMQQVIEKKQIPDKEMDINRYDKIAVDLVMNKQFLTDRINRSTASQNFIYKYVVLPYNAWLGYARSIREDSPDLNLTVFLLESYLTDNKLTHFSAQSPLEWIGTETLKYYLEEWTGEADIWKEQNEVLFSTIKSPLAKDAGKTYRYFFSSRTEIEEIPVYEIVFFSRVHTEKAFEGYLYISVKDLNPVKAVFTLNPFMKKGPAKTVLFTQTASKKETLLTLGNDVTTGLLVEKTRVLIDKSTDSIRQDFLTPPQKEISGLVEESRHTRAYSNIQSGLSFLLTEKIGIFRDNFDFGPITQMVSYNFMEGLRLRTGGNTSQKISKKFAVDGYLAYGTKDEKWKYRGDIIFTPRWTDQIRFTYVNDFNIPGYDCLDDKRDRFYYSFYQAQTKNMSLQKIGKLSYETDGRHWFSMNLYAKYMYDQPLGIVKYEKIENGQQKTFNDITTAEMGASFRFSPAERYVRIKGKRIVFRSPDFDFRLSHRAGFKGVFGSDYSYHITDASFFKSFDFPADAGSFGVRFSAGKVWNSVPFPLLFIPAGNQSYIYDTDGYNLMRFYEFTTDRFLAANARIKFDWSPAKMFFPKSNIRTHWGIKAIYGPLSGINNPQMHPGLFIFNHGVEALGKKAYSETNIGFSGILDIFRIDYVYRLTYRSSYRNKGSLFVSAAINI